MPACGLVSVHEGLQLGATLLGDFRSTDGTTPYGAAHLKVAIAAALRCLGVEDRDNLGTMANRSETESGAAIWKNIPNNGLQGVAFETLSNRGGWIYQVGLYSQKAVCWSTREGEFILKWGG